MGRYLTWKSASRTKDPELDPQQTWIVKVRYSDQNLSFKNGSAKTRDLRVHYAESEENQ